MGTNDRASSYRYSFGEAEFDEAGMMLSIAGDAVAIERRPIESLSILLAHVDEVMTKEELLDYVRDGQVTVESVLANCARVSCWAAPLSLVFEGAC